MSNISPTSPFIISTISPDARGGVYQGVTTFSFCTDVTTSSSGFYVPLGVKTYIDGAPYGTAIAAPYNSTVANTCRARQISPIISAWTLQVDTRALANGPHRLGVTASGSLYLSGSISSRPVSSTAAFPFAVANWTTANPTHISIGRPSKDMGVIQGIINIGGWAFNDNSVIQSIGIAVDGVALGNAAYGGERSDVCSFYPGKPGCPNVGWNALLDTTLLADGVHMLNVTATSASGQSSTVTSSFEVGNASGNPIVTSIDTPAAGETYTGSVNFGGWAVDANDAVSSVELRIDGVSAGLAAYGGYRGDVCFVYPGRINCPNVGWNIPVDTTVLANGPHTVEAVVSSRGGQHATTRKTFNVAN